MKSNRIIERVRAIHRDERGEVTTQQLLYLAIGAIVAAILYKFGSRLLDIVKSFLQGAEQNETTVDPMSAD